MRLAALLITLALPSAAFGQYWMLIHPYEGSKAAGQKNTGEFALPEGPVEGGKLSKSRPLTGKVSVRTFKNPKGTDADKVYAFYEKQLQVQGLEKLWECKGTACGSGRGPAPLFGKAKISDKDRLLTARLPRRQLGDVFFALHVLPETSTLVTVQTAIASVAPEVKAKVAEEAAAEAKRLTAAAIGEMLNKDGYASLSDILYPPGEIALRKEAQPTLDEIAKLLKETPELRLHIVGHTDDVGDINANFALSRKRARWLVKELTKRGVPQGRLRPDGVGPLAPKANNRTEEGRGKNRRVELVVQ